VTAIDVLVVGGGPSGLSAAIAAAEDGSSVILVDEWPEFGGRLRYCRADVTFGEDSVSPRFFVAKLVSRATSAGVVRRLSTVAWSAFAGSRGIEVGCRGTDTSEVLTPTRLILATGTTDRAPIVPGATCPGVLTARALQILLNVHGVRPGYGFAILGDERVTELTADIEAAGGIVTRIISDSALGSVAIYGEDGVRGISVGDERIDSDVVVTALGTLPDSQLAGMLGCEFASNGMWPPRLRRTDDSAVGVPGVSACGTSAGADSIDEAILDGARVGRGYVDDERDRALIATLSGQGV